MTVIIDFDYENRLTEVKQGSTSLATFLYDADGNWVKGTVSGTTVYVAGIYEYQAGATTKYYEGGGLRRTGYSTNNGVFYMLSDHLKSTSALVARNGVLNVKYFYYPYGARRGVPFNTITAKHFTGQYHETSLPGGEGLSFYNARWYDPYLNRFIQPDTIVPKPGDPQSLNRYSYVNNNPVKYTDPTGHAICVDVDCAVVVHPATQQLTGSLYARNIQAVAKGILEILGGVDDLEAMSIISDTVADHYPTWERYLPQMGQIFLGTGKTGTLALPSALRAGGCGGIGREPRDCPGNTVFFQDKGFNDDYRDGHNQPYHVWGYIAQTATPGNLMENWVNSSIVGPVANVFHEVVQSMANIDDGWGTSWQDYVLSEAGMNVGDQITSGLIVSPSEVGDTLRRELGVSGPGSSGQLQRLERRWGPLRGSPS